jgi:hypothetical protein
MFLSKPDRSVSAIHSGKELKQISGQINHALWMAFTEWTPDEWLQSHSAVSYRDFTREPYRNRYAIVVNRAAHISFHLGQAVLVKPQR